MKSLTPVCKRVLPFLAEHKEEVAGIVLVNTIFFLLALTGHYILELLFAIVYVYSNFRVFRLLSTASEFKNKFLLTNIKFFVMFVIQLLVLCVGFEVATWFLPSYNAGVIDWIVAVFVMYIFIYLAVFIQAAYSHIFVNGGIWQNFTRACKGLTLYGCHNRGLMVGMFSFAAFVLLAFLFFGYSFLGVVIPFVLLQVVQIVFNAVNYYLAEDLNHPEVVEENRKELEAILAGKASCCSSTTKTTSSCATSHNHCSEQHCHVSCIVTVLLNPEFYLLVVGCVIKYCFLSLPGLFQYVYGFCGDCADGHRNCVAERKQHKEHDEKVAENRAEADKHSEEDKKEGLREEEELAKHDREEDQEKVVPTATVDNEDSLKHLLEAPEVDNSSQESSETDALVDEFEVTEDYQNDSSHTTDSSELETDHDTLEELLNTKEHDNSDHTLNPEDNLDNEFKSVEDLTEVTQQSISVDNVENEVKNQECEAKVEATDNTTEVTAELANEASTEVLLSEAEKEFLFEEKELELELENQASKTTLENTETSTFADNESQKGLEETVEATYDKEYLDKSK